MKGESHPTARQIGSPIVAGTEPEFALAPHRRDGKRLHLQRNNQHTCGDTPFSSVLAPRPPPSARNLQ
jgi:hypothetical protein